ncbi:MAG: nucleotide exchange factor GrpE [Gammaproteobacteria bacterium]|nr:nucleotide exchange factor GrpE [Gammaproteobacteria bacterium]|tara:strand:+ start:1700 stop:2281 length:582 start_codon:yes stop_codon:yes gene_type:complete
MTDKNKINGNEESLSHEDSTIEDIHNEDLDDKDSEEEILEENLGTPSYEELLEKKEELASLLLRANADLDNAYKRTINEVEKAHKFGIERLLIELLPVIDNLESALANLSSDSSNEDKEGIELTLKSFETTLDKFGMIPIYPESEKFNPDKHEAVSMEENKDKKDGYVGDILQRGWELHSRVLRPARVTVIKN